MKNKIYSLVAVLILCVLVASACKKDPIPDISSGNIHIDFDFKVDGKDLLFDTLIYTNEAGNEYLVYEIEFFISNLTIFKNGVSTILNAKTKMYYVGTKIPSTFSWDVYDEVAPGDYDSLSFTFGLTDSDNQSHMFVESPEKYMIWSEYIGGGYHYMKLYGKYITSSGELRGYTFHLGRGQVYDTTHAPISFIDNSFRVSLPNSDFSIVKGKKTNMTIRMHLQEWFKNPTVYDHNTWVNDQVINQDALRIIVQNGGNVFEYVKP